MADETGVGRLLDEGGVSPLFQPIVDLDRDQVAGYEALARGPAGPLHCPKQMFAAARSAGRLAELDWLCRQAAVDTARRAGLRMPLALFVNAEPETLIADEPDAARWGEFFDVRCYCELTERDLTRDPGRLLGAVDRIRARDWGVALDDVGADPASLALLPLLQPDVIKLDLRLLQQQPRGPFDVETAQLVHGALAQAVETGAAVIAEGIETEAQLELARAYGVGYGQGFLLGRPAPLPTRLETPAAAMPLISRVVDRALTPGPFAVLASAVPTRRIDEPSLRELARQLLARAAALTPEPAVLLTSPDPLDEPLPQLLGELAGLPLLGVLGADQPGTAAARLVEHDPAGLDFAVAVVNPHFAAALVARPTVSGSGRFDAVLTLDRGLSVGVATALLMRLGVQVDQAGPRLS